jgi:hypothetical protein
MDNRRLILKLPHVQTKGTRSERATSHNWTLNEDATLHEALQKGKTVQEIKKAYFPELTKHQIKGRMKKKGWIQQIQDIIDEPSRSTTSKYFD